MSVRKTLQITVLGVLRPQSTQRMFCKYQPITRNGNLRRKLNSC
jgi:hypothetical protein